jgi:hypothetical protein
MSSEEQKIFWADTCKYASFNPWHARFSLGAAPFFEALRKMSKSEENDMANMSLYDLCKTAQKYVPFEMSPSEWENLNARIKTLQIARQEEEKNVKPLTRFGSQCPAWDELMSISCRGEDVELSEKNYNIYYPKSEAFLQKIISEVKQLHRSCFGGVIALACNLDAQWAEVYEAPDLYNCRKSPMTVFSVNVWMGQFKRARRLVEELQILDTENALKGHRMALLLDNENKELELYEPNGGETLWGPLVKEALQAYLGRQLTSLRKYRWIDTHQFCPRIMGPQTLSGRKMCVYYSLLWIYLRLHCPAVDRGTLTTILALEGKVGIDRLLKAIQCKLATL